MTTGTILYVNHQITDFDASQCLLNGYVIIIPQDDIVDNNGVKYCSNYNDAVIVRNFRIDDYGENSGKGRTYRGTFKPKNKFFKRKIYFDSDGVVTGTGGKDRYVGWQIACISPVISTDKDDYNAKYTSEIDLTNNLKDFNIVDKFAAFALNGFINQMNDPINADDTELNRVADQAYQLALNMVINSYNVRNGYAFREADSSVNVTVNTSTTETNSEETSV